MGEPLIDAHVHLVPGALAQSLIFGVTTVLDMFSQPALVARAKSSTAGVEEVVSAGVDVVDGPSSTGLATAGGTAALKSPASKPGRLDELVTGTAFP